MNNEKKLRQLIRYLIIEALELDELDELDEYDKDKMKCNTPQRAAAGKKQKKTVKACKDGKEKILHYGYRGMEDYTQHGDKDRRANFRARMKCDSADAKNKLTRRYWACKDLW